jgi:hypothetical protein
MKGPNGLPQNAIEVAITEAKEVWSEYKLDDGTVVRVRPIVTAFFRIPGQYTQDGEPNICHESNHFSGCPRR